MMTIDEMRAELKAAGYAWHIGDIYDTYHWINIHESGWGYENFDDETTEQDLIQIAYAHYQREKQFQAMRELLKEMIAYADAPLPDKEMGISQLWAMGSARLMAYTEKARQLLAEIPQTG